jgi:membrane protease YdiL (CAAX protease family)
MNTALKAACLAIYLLAIVGAFGVLPAGITSILQKTAVILLAAHVLELLFAYKRVQRYQGPLVDSIALTLLFGLLHWKPLARQS